MPKVSRFFANQPDDQHCFQAIYQMIVASISDDLLTTEEAERETGFQKGKSTWAFKGMRSWAERGYEVIYVDDFEVDAFAIDPLKALAQIYGTEMAEHINRKSDLAALKADVDAWAKCDGVSFFKRTPDLNELRRFIDEKYLVVVNVNIKKLHGSDGYNGHFVIVEEVEDETVVIQDPGLPPHENFRCETRTLIASWLYPDEKAASIMAVRRRI